MAGLWNPGLSSAFCRAVGVAQRGADLSSLEGYGCMLYTLRVRLRVLLSSPRLGQGAVRVSCSIPPRMCVGVGAGRTHPHAQSGCGATVTPKKTLLCRKPPQGDSPVPRPCGLRTDGRLQDEGTWGGAAGPRGRERVAGRWQQQSVRGRDAASRAGTREGPALGDSAVHLSQGLTRPSGLATPSFCLSA